MSIDDNQNPYETPSHSAEQPPFEPEPLPFGEALSRGCRAAHKTLVGAVVVFAIIGPIQVVSSLSGALMMQGNVFQPPEPGQPPPPELFMMMGFGCFTCFWLLIVLFAMPWASGGIYGQVIDRIRGDAAGPFSRYARQFYGRYLLLLLIYIAVLIVLFIPVWGVGAALSANQMQGGQFDPDKLRELNRHPLNIAVGIVFAITLTGLSTVVILAQSALAVTNCGTVESIGRAFRFVSERFLDTAKLFLVFVVISIPIFALQQVGNFLPTVSVAIATTLGAVLAIYLAYISVLNAGIGASVYLARAPK